MLYNTRNPHGGDVYGAAVTLDFSANVHPLGTPPGVIEAIRDAAAQVRQYPDPYCRALTAAIAAHEGVPQSWVLCGGGAAELIYAYCDALRPRLAAGLVPAFSEYRAAAVHFGARFAQHPLCAPDFLPDEGLLAFLTQQKPDVLFLCTPNNPTGVLLPRGLLESALRICRAQGMRVLLDECFLDFTDASSAKDLLDAYPNLLILKAFTKNYALAGVRVGYSLTADPELLEKMSACSQPWNVSVLAQAAGLAALREPDWPASARALITAQRSVLTAGLTALGLSVCPSQANYLLFRGPAGLDAALLRQKIAIRSCAGDPGLGEGWYRAAVRLPEENQALLEALQRGMEEEVWR